MIKKRNDSLDIISGIMILWMIVYHSFIWAGIMINESVYYEFLIKCLYFFMPWFYFKSGYVFNNKYSLKLVVEKGISQLLIPMIIWTAIGYLLTIPNFIIKEYPIWKILINPEYYLLVEGDTVGNEPLWFLLSLFWVRVTMKLLADLKLSSTIAIALSLAFIGWYLQHINSSLPLGLENYPLGLFFGLSGVVCNQLKINQKITKLSLVFFVATLLTSLLFASYVDVHNNRIWFGSYWMYIINSLLAINTLVVIIGIVKFGFLKWIGRKSLFYLVLHWPIFYVIKALFFFIDSSRDSYFYMIILIFTAIIISSLIAKFIPDKYLGLDGAGILKRGKLIFKKLEVN